MPFSLLILCSGAAMAAEAPSCWAFTKGGAAAGPRSLTDVAQLTRLELAPPKFDVIDYRFLSKHDYGEISE